MNIEFDNIKTASAIPGAAAMIDISSHRLQSGNGSCRYCGQLDIGIGQKRMD